MDLAALARGVAKNYCTTARNATASSAVSRTNSKGGYPRKNSRAVVYLSISDVPLIYFGIHIPRGIAKRYCNTSRNERVSAIALARGIARAYCGLFHIPRGIAKTYCNTARNANAFVAVRRTISEVGYLRKNSLATVY